MIRNASVSIKNTVRLRYFPLIYFRNYYVHVKYSRVYRNMFRISTFRTFIFGCKIVGYFTPRGLQSADPFWLGPIYCIRKDKKKCFYTCWYRYLLEWNRIFFLFSYLFYKFLFFYGLNTDFSTIKRKPIIKSNYQKWNNTPIYFKIIQLVDNLTVEISRVVLTGDS